ncbi:12215_t:CDS:1, partial [Entrophospora sp. SA101]
QQQQGYTSSSITTTIIKVKNIFLPLQEFYNKEFINYYLELSRIVIAKLFNHYGNDDDDDDQDFIIINLLVDIIEKEEEKDIGIY